MKRSPIKKRSTNPRKVLIHKLDAIFSKFIRQRDSVNGKNTCFTCGKVEEIRALDAGHFMHRDKVATRFDERNVQPQCRRCNRFQGGRQAEFGIALDEKYGAGTARELIDKSYILKKYSIEELEEVVEYYKNKVKQLEEE